MRRNSDDEIGRKILSDVFRRNRIFSQMNAVGFCRKGNIGAIVDKQPRSRILSEFCRLCGQFKEKFGGNFFFADLNKCNVVFDGGFDQREKSFFIFVEIVVGQIPFADKINDRFNRLYNCLFPLFFRAWSI